MPVGWGLGQDEAGGPVEGGLGQGEVGGGGSAVHGHGAADGESRRCAITPRLRARGVDVEVVGNAIGAGGRRHLPRGCDCELRCVRNRDRGVLVAVRAGHREAPRRVEHGSTEHAVGAEIDRRRGRRAGHVLGCGKAGLGQAARGEERQHERQRPHGCTPRQR